MLQILHKLSAAALWTAAGLLPIRKNRVVFSSYYGRSASDSPAAICDALRKKQPNADILWILKDPASAALPDGVHAVAYDSPRRIFALATARVWVDNCRKGAWRKRHGQYYMQTWHGFALKRIEKDAQAALPDFYPAYARRDSRQCDLIVSNSRFMTGVYRRAFWYDGPVAELGSPRNDVFFQLQPGLRDRVLHAFGLPMDRKLVLYAPTFRSDLQTDVYGLAPAPLLEACTKRFGGQWTLLVRLHPNVDTQSAGLFAYDGQTILDATRYPEMRDLLYAADLLITDYSSCMFDFALSGKPCLQFATDIEAYRNDRNFYFPLDDLPFPLAQDNAALSRAIACFDETAYARQWTAFTAQYGFCEDGHASERCAEWIADKLG